MQNYWRTRNRLDLWRGNCYEDEGAVGDLYEAIKPHPTLSETLMEATLYKMEELESIGGTWHHTHR